MSYTIFHNPRCRKSRETLALLEEQGIEPEIRLYLENPPSVKELQHLSKLLGMEAVDFMRKNEAEYKEYVKGRHLNEKQLFEMMSEMPKLIERPIVVKDDQKAILGRPPENVKELL